MFKKKKETKLEKGQEMVITVDEKGVSVRTNLNIWIQIGILFDLMCSLREKAKMPS